MSTQSNKNLAELPSKAAKQLITVHEVKKKQKNPLLGEFRLLMAVKIVWACYAESHFAVDAP